MHASRGSFVSGQQQQIFLPDLMPTFRELLTGAGAGAGVDDEFPMVEIFEMIFEDEVVAVGRSMQPLTRIEYFGVGERR